MGKSKNNKKEKEDYREQLAALLVELEGQAPAENAMTEEERRRLMSDPEIKYAVCLNQIHDKSCPLIKAMSSEFFTLNKTYLSHMKQCPICAKRAFIRYGAQDMNNYDKYIEFFEDCNMTDRDIRCLFQSNNCVTRLDGDVMSIHNREDNWKIINKGNGMVKLMHNNYIINPDDTRTFTSGFHTQIEETTMKKAVAVLTSYNSSTSARAHIRDTSGEIESRFRKAYKKISFHNKLKLKIRKRLMKIFNLNTEVHIDGFKTVKENGYPPNDTLCAYIWETENEIRFWHMGIYSEDRGAFYASYLGRKRNIKKEKIIAWKAMTNNDFVL
ncbi:MAG: hypothetical protein IJ903_05305 [Ruminococcus sp.]|nr:hypothetical protein [Ruminococcus sp.]